MNSNIFEDVKKFMVASDQTVNEDNGNQSELYLKLIDEEYDELFVAKDDIDDLDACGDLIWVIIGYCYSKGWDIEGALKEITRSNMSKIDKETGKVLKREDGKILKPESYSPPNLESFL